MFVCVLETDNGSVVGQVSWLPSTVVSSDPVGFHNTQTSFVPVSAGPITGSIYLLSGIEGRIVKI